MPDKEKSKLLGVPYNELASSAVQSMLRPCLLFRNGYKPEWQDISLHFAFAETGSTDAKYAANRYLTGLSIAMLASGLYPMNGWKWWFGAIVQPGLVLPVPTGPEDLLTGPINHYASWFGRVPAPYGFGVWSHKIPSGAHVYVNAILEDD